MLYKKLNMLKRLSLTKKILPWFFTTNLLYVSKINWIFFLFFKGFLNFKENNQIDYSAFSYSVILKNESRYFFNIDLVFAKQLFWSSNIFSHLSTFIVKKKTKKWTFLRSVFIHSNSKEAISLNEWKGVIFMKSTSKNFLLHNFLLLKIKSLVTNRSSNFIVVKIYNSSAKK